MIRRPLIAALALAGTAALSLASPAGAQTIKIGWINSYSGFLAGAGDEMEKGLNLYLKEHEKDLPSGVKIEIVRRDDTSVPETAKRLAQELITREHVNLLAGVVASPNATAIGPLTAEAKLPFVITNAGGVAIVRISPYIVRFSFTQWHTCYPLGKWIAQNRGKKAYTAVSDFIPGHDAENAFSKSFGEAGGTITNKVRFPTTNPDFAPIVQRIKDAKPDVAFVWVPAGPQSTAILKTMKDLGLREAGVVVTSTQDLVPDEELPNMGDIPVGLITAGNYSAAGDRPTNKAFVAAWNKAYGNKGAPNFLSVGAWDGMDAIFALIKKTNGKFTADEAMAFFKAYKSDRSPRGPISIDPATRDIIQNIYIRETKMVNGKLANIEFDTIPNVKDPWKEFNPPK